MVGSHAMLQGYRGCVRKPACLQRVKPLILSIMHKPIPQRFIQSVAAKSSIGGRKSRLLPSRIPSPLSENGETAVTPAGTPSPEAVQRAGVACVKRLPAYLQMLRVIQGEGREFVSGTVLASTHNLEPVIVRKDLANTGITGTPRRGFRVSELILAIEKFLGWDNQTKAILVGVGNLGTALLGYRGFEEFGLRIVGAFDADPKKIGAWVRGRRIQPLNHLEPFVRRGHITLGVLTVPAAAAQAAADLMIHAGIRGIWNFTPTQLRLPPQVVTQKENLAEGLAVLSHRLMHRGPVPAR